VTATRSRLKILTLHRYYIYANLMRTLFDQELAAGRRPVVWDEIEPVTVYQTYWYAALYVVIEGWQKLRLTDPAIDDLIRSPFVATLKEHRNSTFHFFPKYYDDRRLQFLLGGADSAGWMRGLNQQFGRYFLERFAEWKAANEQRGK
jgi:hypothetical protein